MSGQGFSRQEAPIAPTKKKTAAPKKPVKKTATKKAPAKKVAAPKKAPAKKAEAKKPVVKKTAAPAPKATGKKKTEHKMFNIIMDALDKEKADNVVSIDLSGKSAIADYMVIVSGTSSRHVSAMAEKLKQKLGGEGFRCRIEGKATGDWVILDAGDVIVHLFRPEVRSFYNLEKLWMSDFSTVGYNLYTNG